MSATSRSRARRGMLALALGTAACATTNAPQKVLRAPDIALAPGQPYALTVESACRGVWKGPTSVARRSVSTSDSAFGQVQITTTRLQREGEFGECVEPGLLTQLAASVQGRVAKALVAAGHRSAPQGEGVAPLKLVVLGEEVRDLNPPSEHKDSGKDKTCQEACGASECLFYEWTGSQETEMHLFGPPVGGKLQESFDLASGVSRGTQHKIACKGQNPDAWFRDERSYDWRNAYGQSRDEAGQRLAAAFATREEVAAIPLFDSGIDAPSNEKGVALARLQKWGEAATAFEAALSEQTQADPTNRKAIGRVKHNHAAALMAKGELEAAAGAQADAFQTEADSDIEALGVEIARRALDMRKLGIMGKGPTAPSSSPAPASATPGG